MEFIRLFFVYRVQRELLHVDAAGLSKAMKATFSL
jgi:hypothetical protein